LNIVDLGLTVGNNSQATHGMLTNTLEKEVALMVGNSFLVMVMNSLGKGLDLRVGNSFLDIIKIFVNIPGRDLGEEKDTMRGNQKDLVRDIMTSTGDHSNLKMKYLGTDLKRALDQLGQKSSEKH
jgi:hypothetical protein